MDNIYIPIFSIVICVLLFGCFSNAEVNNKTSLKTKVKTAPLTVETIDQTPDSLLLYLIFDHISSTLSSDPEQEFKSVLSLSKPQQAIYIIWGMESEVNNGGFNQYYYNSSGQFAKFAPEALKLVGANQFAALMHAANDVYEKEKDSITKEQDGTIEGFSKSYDNNPLEKFDDQYYKLKEPLMELQIAFIRKNKADFVTQQ